MPTLSSPSTSTSLFLNLCLDHIPIKTAARNQAELISQLSKTNSVATTSSLWHNPNVAKILTAVDRAIFVKHVNYVDNIYTNEPIQLGFNFPGCTLSTPQHHALLISTLLSNSNNNTLQGKRILDIGCGSGYLTAVLAGLVFDTDHNNNNTSDDGFVLGVERVPQLIPIAQQCLQHCPITSSFINKIGITHAYYSNQQPSTTNKWNIKDWLAQNSNKRFDIIHVGFAFQSEDDIEFNQLKNDVLTLNENGIILGGLQDNLCLWKRTSTTNNNKDNLQLYVIKNIPGLAPIQYGDYHPPETRSERKLRLKKILDEWVIEFTTRTGKKPTRNDIQENIKIKLLFEEFTTL
jgi:protein-L-isoaspartate O-methyltransferase